ncbi:hypothetical protein FHS19_006831 [Paenibacillus rhizosphaerae]|uniref:Uncharacterized protein n=1 Tax=Paenibacillus rhizosphaerae TaxID=297318 RepID=A0A839TXW9_9BACL|nr:hypothetical protein [Paenibacillus rhizosphaerae]MBB3132104.1 hypothetical protein [Paenibacillus rhizosphaerae]
MIRDQTIYIGPTLPKDGLVQNQVFFNGIPGRVYDMLRVSAALQRLLVPIHLMPAIRRRLEQSGTPEYQAYAKLAPGSVSIQNDEGVSNIMSSSYYDTPTQSKQINSAGEIVNPADTYEGDVQRVKIKATAQDVTLQNATTAAGDGKPFAPTDGNYTLTYEITGTSTSRTVVFEIAGPSGVFIPTTAFNVTDPTKYGPQTTGGSNGAPESWQVEVPAGYSFRARLSSVAGGNVTIKGKAVT